MTPSASQPSPLFYMWFDAAGTWTVELLSGETSVSRGQACVFYADASDRAQLLGGGFIAETSRTSQAGGA